MKYYQEQGFNTTTLNSAGNFRLITLLPRYLIWRYDGGTLIVMDICCLESYLSFTFQRVRGTVCLSKLVI